MLFLLETACSLPWVRWRGAALPLCAPRVPLPPPSRGLLAGSGPTYRLPRDTRLFLPRGSRRPVRTAGAVPAGEARPLHWGFQGQEGTWPSRKTGVLHFEGTAGPWPVSGGGGGAFLFDILPLPSGVTTKPPAAAGSLPPAPGPRTGLPVRGSAPSHHKRNEVPSWKKSRGPSPHAAGSQWPTKCLLQSTYAPDENQRKPWWARELCPWPASGATSLGAPLPRPWTSAASQSPSPRPGETTLAHHCRTLGPFP